MIYARLPLQIILKKKDMNDFYKKNNFIIEEDFINDCYEVFDIYSRDYLLSDDNNEFLLFYNSFIIKTIVNYMKKRIKDDIKGDIYSSQKMVIISGLNTSLSAQELFFNSNFDENEQYIFPIYASQMNLELSRKEVNENSRKNLQYSDYIISEYFNDRLVFNMTFNKFLEKIEKINLWEDSNFNLFCGFKSEEVREEEKKEEIEKEKEKEKEKVEEKEEEKEVKKDKSKIIVIIIF